MPRTRSSRLSSPACTMRGSTRTPGARLMTATPKFAAARPSVDAVDALGAGERDVKPWSAGFSGYL